MSRFLPRRPLAFSLRTLMVLVTLAALGVWAWTLFQTRPEERLQAALLAISRDNPNADTTVYRGEDRVIVTVHNASRVSSEAARLVGRADLICYIKWFADDGTIEMNQDALAALESTFPDGVGALRRFDTGYSGVSCNRGAPENVGFAEYGKRERWKPPAP